MFTGKGTEGDALPSVAPLLPVLSSSMKEAEGM